MLLRSYHRTVYSYAIPVRESHNEVRLEPLTDLNQTCRKFGIATSPVAKIFSFEEIGGRVHHFTIRPPHPKLAITVEAEVETFRSNPFEGLNLLIHDIDFYRLESTRQEFAEFIVPSTYVSASREVNKLASEMLQQANGVSSQFLLGLNQLLFEMLTYDSDVTHVHTTVDEVIQLRAGVCQDFAHLMIACCRSVGIPARYVSGYLHSDTGSGIRGCSAMHAWVEVPIPGGKWLALDPTNNLLANDHHIRVHTGRDYADITPLRGLYRGPQTKAMEVTIRVEEIEKASVEDLGLRT